MIINTENKTGFNQNPIKTASVAVKALGSEGLKESQIESIRYLVSFAAGLSADSVTVADLNTGAIYHDSMESGGMAGKNLYLAVRAVGKRPADENPRLAVLYPQPDCRSQRATGPRAIQSPGLLAAH